MTAPAATSAAQRVLTPECRLGECKHCQPGDIVTRYGDVALTIRCDHPCHKGGAR